MNVGEDVGSLSETEKQEVTALLDSVLNPPVVGTTLPAVQTTQQQPQPQRDSIQPMDSARINLNRSDTLEFEKNVKYNLFHTNQEAKDKLNSDASTSQLSPSAFN